MRKLSGDQIAKIKTLYREGKSERAIARAIGCSRSAVWYQLQKYFEANSKAQTKRI